MGMMKSSFLLAGLSALFPIASTFAANDATAPTVNLGYATYQGTFDTTLNQSQFLGIRYASPPLGSLRFAAPNPPQKVQGTQLATTFPAECMQAGSGGAATSPFLENSTAAANPAIATARRVLDLDRRQSVESSEDCLFLNVFVPGTIDSKKRLPVLVWIHGGGYEAGAAVGNPGSDLVKNARSEMITVVIQYRLGLFGFLAGKGVKEGGGDVNVGLLDQQFALQWVQEHITTFGGSPSHVTIWGESAGAGSVLQHTIANGGETNPPLFERAMTSSTFLPSQYPWDGDIPNAMFQEVVSMSGCTSTPSQSQLACLRAVNSSILQEANTAICTSVFFGTFAFVPVVDGELIRESPGKQLRAGAVNGDLLLSVTNSFEGSVFVSSSDALSIPAYVQNLFPTLDEADVQAAAKQYEGLGLTDEAIKIGIMGETIFICPSYYLLQAFQTKGRPRFKGELAIPPGNHGEDIDYYFTSFNANGIPPFNNTLFDVSFPDAFFSTIVNGNPNVHLHSSSEGNITPLWPQWIKALPEEMLFNKTGGAPPLPGDPIIEVEGTDKGLLERCQFWSGLGEKIGQ